MGPVRGWVYLGDVRALERGMHCACVFPSREGAGRDGHPVFPVLVLPLTSEGEPPDEVIERMAQADLRSPLCDICTEADIHDRSPEQCAQCAKLRARAAFAALTQK